MICCCVKYAEANFWRNKHSLERARRWRTQCKASVCVRSMGFNVTPVQVPRWGMHIHCRSLSQIPSAQEQCHTGGTPWWRKQTLSLNAAHWAEWLKAYIKNEGLWRGERGLQMKRKTQTSLDMTGTRWTVLTGRKCRECHFTFLHLIKLTG